MDAVGFARLVQAGKISARELVEEAVKRIRYENDHLNAVIHERFEEALNESEQTGLAKKPFGGVPILLKGLSQPMANAPDTSGAHLFANHRAQQSSNFVQRLIDAGFIVLGQTNVPEFGFKNVTDSQLYGDARHPFDIRRSPGGSSGGSASAVAAGWVPLAGASDGGGSIRIPASYTGLIGLKPSRGRIVTGPGDMRGWGGASIPFVLTKSVRDTVHLLYLLEGKQAEAPYGIAPLVPEPAWKPIDFSSLRIGFTTQSPVGSVVSEDAIRAVEEALCFFRRKGSSIKEAAPAYDGVHLMNAYYTMNGAETAAMMRSLVKSLQRELTPADMEPMTWAIYQYGKKLTAADYIDALSTWDDAAKIMTDYHRDYDLFLTPTTAEVAPLLSTPFQTLELLDELVKMDETTPLETAKQLIYTMFETSLSVTPFTQLANLTGQPAISLPIYRNVEGLPLGIQLMALKGNESLLLQVAQTMEEENLFNETTL